MKVIGIDPGTLCGWSVVDDESLIASGVWNLKGGRHEGGGMRYLRMRILFTALVKEHTPNAVSYEIIRRHAGTDAAHIYGGIISQIAVVCEERRIPFKGVAVGTIKATATGIGNASKAAMITAANEKWHTEITDDNEADACWVAKTLIEGLS